MTSKRGEATKLKMILAAMDLFHEKGIHATSPQDVLERTGTGKSQFYHYFGSKDGLILATLEYFYEEQRAGNFNNKPITTWEDLDAWFQFFLDIQHYYRCERSCPIGTIANELDTYHHTIRQCINAIFDETIRNLAQFFEQQQQNQMLDTTISAEELARFCFLTIQGGMLVSKVQRNIQPLKDAVKHAQNYIDSLKR